MLSVRHRVCAGMLVALCRDSVMGKVSALVSKGHSAFEVRLGGMQPPSRTTGLLEGIRNSTYQRTRRVCQ